jgi:hypothetical protein
VINIYIYIYIYIYKQNRESNYIKLNLANFKKLLINIRGEEDLENPVGVVAPSLRPCARPLALPLITCFRKEKKKKKYKQTNPRLNNNNLIKL